MKKTVLIVEDEKTLSLIIADTLAYEGFETLQAYDGEAGLKLFLERHPDIVIADVMMPQMDGFEMVRKIRATDAAMPILFLSARTAIEDLVSGFELGANDYLRKPFKMQELIIRVKALLRVADRNVQTIFTVGHYTFNSVSQTIVYGNDIIELSHFENEIFKRLCANINRVVDIQSLMFGLWFDDCPYNRNSLHGYIHKLRKLLVKDDTVKILNLRGIGYKLNG